MLVITSLLLTCVVLAQTGKITGKVLNSKNEALQGVSVKLIGEPGGTTTDLEGRFTINLQPAKKFELGFSAVGYETKTINEVEAVAGQVTELNVTLEVAGSKLETVTVTATKTSARRETVNSLIQFQKNTNTVAAVVSAEAIRRSPDRNTGEVLKRVPGTSIQDGKYIIVRGLSDRYNMAMLNGIPLSSTEPDRKNFAFDIFPAPMIDNIIINKAFVPEYPGEWAGGLIQVNTKDIPSAGFLGIQVGTGFNSQTIGKDFFTYKGGEYDWAGIDDGSRDLPTGFPRKSLFNKLSNEEKTVFGKNFQNRWPVMEGGLPLNTQFQINGGFNTRFLSKKVGGILSVTYNKSNRRLEFRNRFPNINLDREEGLNFDYYNNRYSQDVLWGALANVAIQLNSNNKISFKNLFNVNASDYTTLRTGIDNEVNSNTDNIRARELGFKSNLFFNTQVSGEHNLPSLQTKFSWYGNFNILDQYVPNQRRLQYNQNSTIPNSSFVAQIGNTLSQRSGSIFYSMLSDYIYTAGGDLTKTLNFFNNNQTVKVGYLLQVKDRLFDSKPFSITLNDIGNNDANGNGHNDLLELDEDRIFSPENFGSNLGKSFDFNGIVGDQYRYLANTILNAAYVQFDNLLTDKLRIVWGVRFESFDQLVGSVKQSDNRFVNTKKEDFLPAINLTYKFTPKTNLRLTGSQTVVRPEFRELSNFAFYDFELGATILGSKSLQRTKVSNFDLRYELYPRAGELFTLGVFYKYFKQPIELYYNNGAGNSSQFNYANVDNAQGYGVEFEMRKKLDFVDVLRNFTFQTNLSYIHNRVKGENLDRPMQGQSPYLINSALQYDVERYGISTTLLFNQIGRRILYVGNDIVPAVWEAPRPLLDFQIAKKLIAKKAEIKLNISDIFNRRARFYYDLDDSGKYETGKRDALFIDRLYGTNFSVTFGYNIL